MTAPDFDLRTPLLVLGGARSGKSTWAESVINRLPPPYVYVATAQALDDEMKLRIKLHRERRKELWETIESPTDLQAVLRSLDGRRKPVLRGLHNALAEQPAVLCCTH